MFEVLWSSVVSFLIALKPEGKSVKKWALFVSVFILGGYSFYFFSSMKRKPNVDMYLKKSSEIKFICKEIRKEFKADNVAVFYVHNGNVTIDNVHQKRFTLVTFSDNYFTTDQRYEGEPMEPYAEYFVEMIENGWFCRDDISADEDPILNMVSSKIKKKGIIYLPIKINGLDGFCTISYNEKHKFNIKEIQRMSRFVEMIRVKMEESIGL